MIEASDLPIQHRHDEMERNAYNAAFYELGFRWHWDRDTYGRLMCQGLSATECVRQYLETQQPHLLKAYDAAFLIDIIQEKKAEHRKREAAPDAMSSEYFDWAETIGSEIGA